MARWSENLELAADFYNFFKLVPTHELDQNKVDIKHAQKVEISLSNQVAVEKKASCRTITMTIQRSKYQLITSASAKAEIHRNRGVNTENDRVSSPSWSTIRGHS